VAATAAMPRAVSRERASSAQSGLVGPAAPVNVAQFDFDRAHPTLAFKHFDRSKDEESYRAFLVRVSNCTQCDALRVCACTG
jgi:hypothetical protein